MPQDNTSQDADAYYGNEEIDSGEIDLSFLDEDDSQK